MPDPNQTNPIQNSPTPLDSPPVASPVFPQSDLPPLPPTFQSVVSGSPTPPPVKPAEETIPTPINKPVETSGSAAPVSELPPVISSGPKKKFGGGRVIATILGLFLLVGGVGAGIVLTQQPQLLGSFAAKKNAADIGSPSAGRHAAKVATENAQSAANVAAEQAQTSQNTGGYTNFVPTGVNTSASPPPGTYAVYQNGASSGTVVGYRYISSPGVYAGAVARAMTGNVVDEELLQYTYNMSPADITAAQTNINNGLTWVPPGVGGVDYWHWTVCDTGTGTNGVGCVSTPTQTTGGNTTTTINAPDTAQCLGVTAYSATWVALTAADLPTQKPDTTINFCVTGGSTSGSFDKAQFKIGATLEPETTTIRPGSTNEFCQSYKILSTDTTVNVQAKIHHATLGWEGEAI